MSNRWRKSVNSDRFFLSSRITVDGDYSHEIKKCLLLGRKAMTNLDSILKGLSSQSYGFASSHVWRWELDYKESWAPKNWCFWTVVLEKPLESPLDCKEIQPVNPKGNQSWIFTERTDAEAETLASVLPMNIQDWFPLGMTGLVSLQSKGRPRVFSITAVQKHQFFGA